MSKKELSREEICKELSKWKASKNITDASMPTELMDDELDLATGGMGAFPFEIDGYMWAVYCNKTETNNPMFEHSIATQTACMYRNPLNARTCFDCQHMYMGNTGVKTQ